VDDTDSEGDDLILHSSSSVLGRMVTLPGHAAMAMFGGTLMLAPVASRKKAREYFLVKVYGRSANTVIGSSTFFSGWMKPNTTQEWVKGLGLYSPTSDSVNVFVSATVNDGGTIRASQQGQPHAISLNV
jgi:hypothetical protein